MLPSNKKHIILIGLMGSGKTTIGKTLSHITGRPFLDTDLEIENQQNKSTSQIFETEGENAWREYETRLGETFASLPPHIISTGGGFILSPQNQKIIKETGIVFWLNASIETLSLRLETDAQRPLLRTPNKEKTLETLFKSRKTLYKDCSDFEIITNSMTPDEVAKKICATI